ncbi:MAG: hypothetical protein PVI26_01005 [Chitinispirillia bacterium]|jgi:hypothetical protein
MRKNLIFLSVLSILFVFSAFLFSEEKIERIILEEVQIEGKIRRPQLVLIKAEQRPVFSPMIIQSFDNELNIVEFSKGKAVEKSPYTEAFSFDGTKITNYVP